MCNSGHHLDSSTQKCFKVLTESAIANCSVYSGSNTCGYCEAGFSLINGSCETISSPIANCVVENSQNICLQCDTGFILSIDQDACVEDPKVENCQSYDQIECEECSLGFIDDDNFYIREIFNLKTNT